MLQTVTESAEPSLADFTSSRQHEIAEDRAAIAIDSAVVRVTGLITLPEPGFPITAALQRSTADAVVPVLDLTITATDCCIQAAPNATSYRYSAAIRSLPPGLYRLRVSHALARQYDVSYDTGRVRVRVVTDTTLRVTD